MKKHSVMTILAAAAFCTAFCAQKADADAAEILEEEIISQEASYAPVLEVTAYGAIADDAIDDTAAFNSAIEALNGQTGTVHVPAGTWIIDPAVSINLKSNVTLKLEEGSVLKVKPTDKANYSVISIKNASNVTVSGGKIEGERDEHIGDEGEWGHGVGIYDSSNVTVTGMEIASNWGDGVYLGTTTDYDEYYGCNVVNIKGCTIRNNRRSNVSIVDANNVTIEDCRIADAKGKAPQCGINIEPNHENGVIPDDRVCKRIKILNTIINVLGKGDINGQFFCFMSADHPSQRVRTCDDIQISGCTFNGDCGNYSGTNMTISDTVIRGTFYNEQNTKLTNVTCENVSDYFDPSQDVSKVPLKDKVNKQLVREFVRRMYRVTLQREPDDAGLDYWVNEIAENGMTGAGAARGFYMSDEMKNRGLSNAEFVELAYLGIMGRASDAGRDTWISALDAGASRFYVMRGFIGSNEFSELCASYSLTPGTVQLTEARDKNLGITGFVSRLYEKALGRSRDIDGLNYWCAKLLDDPSKASILSVSTSGFFHSKEFLEKELSDADFVKVLYRTFLGRESDDEGMSYWLDKLANGATRDEVLRGFAMSNEFSGIMAEFGL